MLPQIPAKLLASQPGRDLPHASSAAVPGGDDKQDHPGDDVLLDALAQEALTATHADGAAIALDDGAAVVCRAACGDAPEPGVSVQPNVGICGRCLATGEAVLWSAEDGTAPPGIASVVAVPIRRREVTAGLIATFSHSPSAFSAEHVDTLSRIAEMVPYHQQHSKPGPTPETDAADAMRPRLVVSSRNEAAAVLAPVAIPGDAHADQQSRADEMPASVAPARDHQKDLARAPDDETATPSDFVFSAAMESGSLRDNLREGALVLITALILVVVLGIVLALSWRAKHRHQESPVTVSPVTALVTPQETYPLR